MKNVRLLITEKFNGDSIEITSSCNEGKVEGVTLMLLSLEQATGVPAEYIVDKLNEYQKQIFGVGNDNNYEKDEFDADEFLKNALNNKNELPATKEDKKEDNEDLTKKCNDVLDKMLWLLNQMQMQGNNNGMSSKI